MKITVCDLEPAVSLAHHFRPSVEACPNQANVSFAVGDFFKPETIPKADLYVLSHVLHDWSEDKVDLILSNVYKCLPSGNFNRKKVLPFFKGSSTHVRKYVHEIKSKQKILGSARNLQFGSRKQGLLCPSFNYKLRGHQGLQFKQESCKWSMWMKSYTRASKIVALWPQNT